MNRLLLLCVAGLVAGAAAAPQPFEDTQCALCHILVKTIAGLLYQDKGTIEAQLEKQCEALGPFGDTCKKLADEKVEEIVEYLLKGEDQELVCEKLKLCATPSLQDAPESWMPKDTKCSLCKLVVGKAAQYVNDDKKTIEDEVNKLCESLGPVASICKKFADENIDKVIAWLQAGESQAEICQKLSLCVAVEELIGFDVKCTLCHLLVKVIAVELAEDKNKAQIKAEVEKACESTGPLASTCKKLADEKVDEIIAWLQKGEDQDQVCQKISLCVPPSAAPPMM